MNLLSLFEIVSILYAYMFICYFSKQAGRGRGVVARGRAGGPPARGAAANRAGRGGAAGARGSARQAARGVGRAKGSLPGNFYFILKIAFCFNSFVLTFPESLNLIQ